jgi:hypothetical protein
MIELLLAVVLLQEKVATDKRCIECHVKQEDDWKGSVHQKNAIGCVACHGTDEVGTGDKPHAYNKATFVSGKKPPKTSHLVCVECHEGVVKAFEKSAHWEDMRADEDSKVKSCMSCHTHHATEIAEPKAIAQKACSKCHKETSVQWKIMLNYVAGVAALREKVDLLRPKVEHKRPGVSWKAEAAALEEAEQLLKEAAIEQHKAERGRKGGGLKGYEDSLPATAVDVAKAYSSLDSRQQETGKRTLRLLGFLGLLAVTLLLARAWLVRWGHAA